jgi:hypothetical protein
MIQESSAGVKEDVFRVAHLLGHGERGAVCGFVALKDQYNSSLGPAGQDVIGAQ